MLVRLPYGKDSKIELDVPDGNLSFAADIGDVPKVADQEEIILKSLRNPIGRPPLRDMVSDNEKVIVVCDDMTRPTPQDLIIPIVLDELNSAGVPDKNIEVVIALGTHREMSEKEIRSKYGLVTDRVPVRNHSYTGNLVDIGKTPSGIPIIVNRDVYKADVKIGIGNIMPHIYAGWSGGGKIIQPGVCGEQTTGMTHVMAGKIKPITEIAGSPANCIRQEIEAVASKVGLDFIINTVLDKNDDIVNIVSGDPEKAFRRGVEHAERIYCPRIPGATDIVVVSSYPADMDYWQAVKPLTYASVAVQEGGTIVLLSPCPDRISSTHPILAEKAGTRYEELVEMLSENGIEDLVAAGTLLLHSQILERANIICYSGGLTRDDKEALGFAHAENPHEAIEMALESQGQDARVGILKCGKILPRIE